MKTILLTLICLCLLIVNSVAVQNTVSARQVKTIKSNEQSIIKNNSASQDKFETAKIESEIIKFDFTDVESGDDKFLTKEPGVIGTGEGLTLAPYKTAGSINSKRIKVPLNAADPFLAVHSKWAGESLNDKLIKIEIRGSGNGRSWDGWQEIETDPDSISKSDERFGSSVYLDKQTKFVQYRIALKIDENGNSPVIKNIQFVFLSPGASLSQSSNLSGQVETEIYDGQQAVNAANAAQPSVVSRTSWNCPDGQGSPRWQPEYTNVSHLIVHHTKSGNSSSDWKAVVRDIWYDHANLRDGGWGDIGYNFLIDPNGVIYEGRAGGSNVKGNHFSHANSNTMGVALLGDFRTENPQPAALAALKKLLAWKAGERSIDPEGTTYHTSSGLNLKNISGHLDANSSPFPEVRDTQTECPGNALYKLLPTIRHDVRIMMSGCAVSVPADQWKGEYFNNQYLGGSPSMVVNDGTWFLDFDWGNGSPGDNCGIGHNNFSARWTRNLNLSAGVYRFKATGDDGVRLYVDGQLVIDKWQDQAPATYTVDVTLTAGQHNVRFEYYENGVGAVAKLYWEQIASYSNCTASVASDRWKGEYFNNRYLNGSPSMVKDDGTGFINANWGAGGPANNCGIGVDNFSVRWSRNVYFSGTAMYRFTVAADDGVRLYVDGQLKLDKWQDQNTTFTVDTQLNAGTHTVKLEYYENGGGATAKLSWEALTSVFIQPIVWEFNTSGNFDGWTARNASAASVNNGKLFIDPAGYDPFIEGPNINAQASLYKFVQVSLANNGLDDTGAIYFRTQSENYFSDDKKVTFRAINCALCGNAPFYGYTIQMSNHPKWTGTITGLRLDPTGRGQAGTNKDSVAVDYIRLTQSN